MRLSIEERFWSKVDRTPGYGPNGDCWIWTGAKNQRGYGHFGPATRLVVRSHRFAWGLVNGQVPEGLQVLHSCDMRACCNPKHLHLGTNWENRLESVQRGRTPRGDRHPSRRHPEKVPRGEGHVLSRLTDARVRVIREEYLSGVRARDLAILFGISRRTVSDVCHHTWRHVL